MFRRAWKPITTTTVLVGTPSYIYYHKFVKQETFDLAIKSRDSEGNLKMIDHTFPLLSWRTIEARLAENATYVTNQRPSGITWKHTTASLASNDPIEDAHSHAITERDASDSSLPGDWHFYAVMDGHSGTHTSQLLSKFLITAVSSHLSSLTAKPPSPLPSKLLEGVKSVFWSPPPTSSSPALDADPQRVSETIQEAFTQLDREIITIPLKILAEHSGHDFKTIPDLSKHSIGQTLMLPAIAGSCAIMAVLDTAHQNLYVACTGDCRAVAGIWEESPNGQGSWRVEVLSEDQTGRNPKELERMRSEHPPDESDTVIQNGRVLGGLEPTRAFGDARYKWTRSIQNALNQAFLTGSNKPLRATPHSFKTPPYVTSLPVVTHRKLNIPPPLDSNHSTTGSKSTLRFLVLATDGLWDQLSSNEVVALVGGHLSGLHGSIKKSALPALVPTTTGSPTIEGKDHTHNQPKGGSWTFVDDNVSTHLIRNAFGGDNKKHLRKLLSIPAPHSRRFRDDVTVTVIWWEDGREGSSDLTKVKQIKAML